MTSFILYLNAFLIINQVFIMVEFAENTFFPSFSPVYYKPAAII